jgi:5-methylcytosine-specific restriction protein B
MCKEEVQKFSIRRLIELIHDTGLIYSDNLVKRFTFSLMTKPFVILSGLAGSGKTQLALAFAEALVKDKKKQMCVVSVGADWTNREPLLGFPNALQSGQYVKPESGVLDLLIEANKPENADIPFFLVLDEMNMSYVERYFADFLSAMESHEAIRLWDYKNELVPMSVSLPRNLFIIGTINVDETTYMFSPKVLDRANVIEFKISEIEMDGFLHEMKETHRECIWGKASAMASNFVEIASKKELANDANTAKTLQNFFKELKSVNAEFGYRSATEIFRFISQAENNDEEINGKKLTKDEILDAAIVQKLLPKLHGSRKKLEPVLQRLWKLCFAEEIKDIQNITADNIEKAKYKESADKISRMYDSANVNGFTSFAEA